MLDFPNSPALDELFPTAPNQRWRWDGQAWVSAGAGGGGPDQPGSVRFKDGKLEYFDGTTWHEITVSAITPPGHNWTVRDVAGSEGIMWSSVCYGNGLFVAVANTGGSGTRAMTSPDGITWTLRNTPADNQWVSVCYGNNLFVAVANSGTGNRIMTSPDGITWTIRTSPADNQWASVVYDPSRPSFAAVSTTGTTATNRAMMSFNGTDNWTVGSTPTTAQNSWNSVCYANNRLVAVSSSGTGNRVMTSDNGGVNWTARSHIAGLDLAWRSITYDNNVFLAVPSINDASLMSSPDGVTWTVRTNPSYHQHWRSVCYGNDMFVAVAQSSTVSLVGNQVMTILNNFNGTVRTCPSGTWASICYGNGRFVVVGYSTLWPNGTDCVMTSP